MKSGVSYFNNVKVESLIKSFATCRAFRRQTAVSYCKIKSTNYLLNNKFELNNTQYIKHNSII